MKKIHLRHKKTFEEKVAQEINKEVKEVKREWRHLLKFKDENQLLFMSFLVICMAALVINTLFIIQYNSGNFHVPFIHKTFIAADSLKVLTSQQVGSNDSMTVKISNVTENDTVDKVFTIGENETMLILDISITNNTDAKQQLIPVNQFYVRTNEGDYSELHASLYATNPLAAADLSPNQTVKGQLSFSVPKHIAHPLLYVDTGWGNNVPLVFDVLR